jgi:hypothetical protein
LFRKEREAECFFILLPVQFDGERQSIEINANLPEVSHWDWLLKVIPFFLMDAELIEVPVSANFHQSHLIFVSF